ncbi:tryptophan halogenase family protein [Glaciecola sp. 1036]|uniref:tryptophan halogenase family protein n=1 Tax=Alteromonadaceae TaxID=72275 RepID=UPI003D019263
MQAQPIKEILVVGGGTAGWMTAAALANRLPSHFCKVTLVESEAIGTVGVGESTIPHIRQFNETLGIDEATFMKETSATVKLGIRFDNWGNINQQYFHPFGEYGEITKGIDFHQYWLKERAAGSDMSINAYSIAASSGLANKFPLSTHQKTTKFSDYNYSYHIDAGKYALFLRKYAENKGVKRVEGKVVKVDKHENGFLKSVTLEDGTHLQADFFVDCSGFRGLLIDQQMQSQFIHWNKWLLTNSAVAVPSERNDQLNPYTIASAQSAGWRWQIPLQHRMGNGYAYSNAHIDDQTAIDTLMQALPGKALAEPRIIRYQPGRREASWVKNCLAVGLSSGFLEPLESTSIYLIQLGITKFLELLPSRDCPQANINEYNKLIARSYEVIRNFIILHFHVTQRDDTEFWRYCRHMAIPDELQNRLELFAESGRIDISQFGVWPAVCIGQNLIPKYYDSRLDTFGDEYIQQYLQQTRKKISEAVAQMPSADEFIAFKLSQAKSGDMSC